MCSLWFGQQGDDALEVVGSGGHGGLELPALHSEELRLSQAHPNKLRQDALDDGALSQQLAILWQLVEALDALYLGLNGFKWTVRPSVLTFFPQPEASGQSAQCVFWTRKLGDGTRWPCALALDVHRFASWPWGQNTVPFSTSM